MAFDPAVTQEALDTLPINIVILDSDGTIRWTSRAWRQFADSVGAEAVPETLGTNYLDACRDGDEYAQAACEGLQEVLGGDRDDFSLEYPCHTPEKEQWFMMLARPFEVEGKWYVTVAHFEVTERVLAEQEVQSFAEETATQRDHLALLNQLVRHDIRNDIQLVTSHAELLRDAVPPDKQEHVEKVLEQAEHIVELTHAVKELEAAITEDETIELTPINLGAVLQAEADKVRSAYQSEDRCVTVTGTDDLCFETRVLANEMLASVFGNLLSNAIIHNDASDPTVTIGVDVGEETATVSIADNGPGIPESERETIFGRGQMGLESPGTGFGLYLVDRLVDLYDGEVWVTDNDPQGTVFHVRLQLATDVGWAE